ncbi:Hypothetical protein R9X50_00293300 [Acrodontium crateriforme]|uniref:Uncharacterized protein n=1 Tax=Acrodontium crateriforme TaxID=150365 RepID=A0AAQ3M3G4_9PEZI|nr:Hypothetical protein R9X50_00293300 [Acrodontium crateriforme]
MMEFWHCHKPIVADADPLQPGGSKKGYAANSRLALAPGTCLVDNIDFLFAPEDCQTVETTAGSESPTGELSCSKCHTCIGFIDPTAEGYRLRKPHLALSFDPCGALSSFVLEKWLACRLLNSLESQGVRKLSIRSQKEQENLKGLKIWIFAPKLKVSSSAAETLEPVAVAKIMWKEEDVLTKPEKLNAQTLAEGDVEVSSQELRELRECLTKSALLLPVDGRTFQEWQVGVLQTFTVQGTSC